MSFKKIKLEKTNQREKIIPFFISLLSVLIVFCIGVLWLRASQNLDFNLLSFLNIQIPKMNGLETEENEEKKFINILFVWRGGWNHDAPNLTDSIILASIDLNTKITSLLSIPRDLFVKNNTMWMRINEVYMRGLDLEWLEKAEAMEWLKKKISEITGQNIDYYVNIDFNWFIELIDVLGWVEVEVPENFVDNEYPDGNKWYTTFVLRKGTWILDGEVALKYARSRHSTSDFDRSLRQQQIINALKNKFSEAWFFSSPGKIKDLYALINKYIDTDLEIKTIISIALKLKEENQIVSSNLNDTCSYGWADCQKGWFLYVPERSLFWWASVLLPEWATTSNISNYSEIQKFTNVIFNQREIYSENYVVNIFNATKISNLARTIAAGFYKYGFNIPDHNSIGNTKGTPYPNTVILYNNIDENSVTLKAIQHFFNAPLQKTEKALYSSDPNTKIEIILWDDYNTIQSNF